MKNAGTIDLSEKSAVVTVGARGIGRAIGLSEAVDSGRIKMGDKVVRVVCGAGLTSAGLARAPGAATPPVGAATPPPRAFPAGIGASVYTPLC